MRYGLQSNSLEQACEALSQALGLSFEMRESSYWGGDYCICKSASSFAKTQKLHGNLDFYDNEPMYKDQSVFGLILHCEDIQNGAELHDALISITYQRID